MVVLTTLILIIKNDLKDQGQILFCKNFLKIFQQIILLALCNQVAQNLKLYNHK